MDLPDALLVENMTISDVTSIKLNEANALAFIKQIEAFRTLIYSEVHPLTMMIFIKVIIEPVNTVSPTYIKERFNISQAAASRHFRTLTVRKDADKAGLGLCEVRCDPMNPKWKFLALTPKGLQVAQELSKHF